MVGEITWRGRLYSSLAVLGPGFPVSLSLAPAGTCAIAGPAKSTAVASIVIFRIFPSMYSWRHAGLGLPCMRHEWRRELRTLLRLRLPVPCPNLGNVLLSRKFGTI